MLKRLVLSTWLLLALLPAAQAQDLEAYQEEAPIDEPEEPPPPRVAPKPTISKETLQAVPVTPVEAAAEPPPPPINAVKLQGLDKVTARISTMEPFLGTVERFGNLEIIAHRCWQSAPEDRPESAALLEVRELKANEGPAIIFQGWMYASSPALSALEHPVYDITVLSCEHREAE